MRSPPEPVDTVHDVTGTDDIPGAGAHGDPVLDATVMMVDDEPLNMQVLQLHLESAGYARFVTVERSVEALATLRAERPDVLLLDLMMPEVSGFDILRALREDPEHGDLPVIVLTSSTDAETKLAALELGATDFLSKPVDQSELALRVRNTLSGARLAAPRAPPRPAHGAAQPRLPDAPARRSSRRVGRARVRGGADAVRSRPVQADQQLARHRRRGRGTRRRRRAARRRVRPPLAGGERRGDARRAAGAGPGRLRRAARGGPLRRADAGRGLRPRARADPRGGPVQDDDGGAVRRRGRVDVRRRERRHRDARRHHDAGAAPERRRHRARRLARPQRRPVRVLLGRHGRRRARAARHGERAPDGDRRRRDPPRLPAQGRGRDRPHPRRRGARALDPPGVRARLAGRLHPARRARGHDRADRGMGAARGLPPGRRVARARPRRLPHRD